MAISDNVLIKALVDGQARLYAKEASEIRREFDDLFEGYNALWKKAMALEGRAERISAKRPAHWPPTPQASPTTRQIGLWPSAESKRTCGRSPPTSAIRPPSRMPRSPCESPRRSSASWRAAPSVRMPEPRHS